jgi:hypothetical protein
MPIRVACPSCNAVLNAPDASAGKVAVCPECRQQMVLPDAPTGDHPKLPPRNAEWGSEPQAGEGGRRTVRRTGSSDRDDRRGTEYWDGKRVTTEDAPAPARGQKSFARGRKGGPPTFLIVGSLLTAFLVVSGLGAVVWVINTGGARSNDRADTTGGLPTPKETPAGAADHIPAVAEKVETGGEILDAGLLPPGAIPPAKMTGKKYVPRVSEEAFTKKYGELIDYTPTDAEVFEVMGDPTEVSRPIVGTKGGRMYTIYTATWEAGKETNFHSSISFVNGRLGGGVIGMEAKPIGSRRERD